MKELKTIIEVVKLIGKGWDAATLNEDDLNRLMEGLMKGKFALVILDAEEGEYTTYLSESVYINPDGLEIAIEDLKQRIKQADSKADSIGEPLIFADAPEKDQ